MGEAPPKGSNIRVPVVILIGGHGVPRSGGLHDAVSPNLYPLVETPMALSRIIERLHSEWYGPYLNTE